MRAVLWKLYVLFMVNGACDWRHSVLHHYRAACVRSCRLPSGPGWWSAARRRWLLRDCGVVCVAGAARGSEPAGEARLHTGHTHVETAEPVAKDVAPSWAQQNTPPILHPCGVIFWDIHQCWSWSEDTNQLESVANVKAGFLDASFLFSATCLLLKCKATCTLVLDIC